MNTPNLFNGPVGRVGQDGHVHLTPEALGFFINLTSQIQQNLSNEGFVMPSQPTANINLLADKPNSNGSIYYDSDTHQLKANINGVIKIITVT